MSVMRHVKGIGAGLGIAGAIVGLVLAAVYSFRALEVLMIALVGASVLTVCIAAGYDLTKGEGM